MSKRAEQRGLEALPPRWRKTKDDKGKVDSALPVRKFYIRAYEQAEKDLALTWEDAQAIYIITNNVSDVLEKTPLDKWPEWAYGSEGRFKEVLRRFNEWRASNETR